MLRFFCENEGIFLDFDRMVGFYMVVKLLGFIGNRAKRDIMGSVKPAVRVESIKGVEVGKGRDFFSVCRLH